MHYQSAYDTEPTTTRQVCTAEKRCRILNCPFDHFPVEENVDCIRISEMKSIVDDEPLPLWEDDSEEYFLNFAFPGQKITPGSVNGRKFEYPGINSLFQGNQVSCRCHDCLY